MTGQQISEIRRGMGLSQPKFAERFKISVSTLRAWEQGVNRASQYAIIYLKLIENNPELIANEVREITARR